MICMFVFIILFFNKFSVLGIDGQEDMKLIFGTIVVDEKDRLEKEDKVIN